MTEDPITTPAASPIPEPEDSLHFGMRRVIRISSGLALMIASLGAMIAALGKTGSSYARTASPLDGLEGFTAIVAGLLMAVGFCLILTRPRPY